MTEQNLTITAAVRRWWREQRQDATTFTGLRRLLALLWEFLRDSFPDRRRRRYGDIDYDWEYRVDTTGATVAWRTRLLGLLNSPYQPIEPELFREMIGALNVDFGQYTFIDVGSGKGRALLLACEYPFRRVVGIELMPELNRIAEENTQKFAGARRKCESIQSFCGDATQFQLPNEPLVILLFNPLPKAGLARFINNLERSIEGFPRSLLILYANPIFEDILVASARLRKLTGTHQYAIFDVATVAASQS